jgi:regulatory protein
MPETVDSINELNKSLFKSEETDSFCDPIEARKKAMNYLARREYGHLELQGKLENVGFDAETTRITVDNLADEGLQCDRRFIESFIQSRINQGKGPVRIRLDLDERKLESSLIDELLSECSEDWIAMAQQIRKKKFGPKLPVEFKEKARQMSFLQYRGFESNQIQAAIMSHGQE